jgi:hypothetical protein
VALRVLRPGLSVCVPDGKLASSLDDNEQYNYGSETKRRVEGLNLLSTSTHLVRGFSKKVIP